MKFKAKCLFDDLYIHKPIWEKEILQWLVSNESGTVPLYISASFVPFQWIISAFFICFFFFFFFVSGQQKLQAHKALYPPKMTRFFFFLLYDSVGWGSRMIWLHLCWGVQTPPMSVLDIALKSDGEAPVMGNTM